MFGLMAFLGSVGLFGTGLFVAKEVKDRAVRAKNRNETFELPKPDAETAYGYQGEMSMRRSIKDVVADHADYTAEVLSLYVNGKSRSTVMKELRPGDAVDIRFDSDGIPAVFVKGRFMGNVHGADSSRLGELLESRHGFDAYLAGRDLEYFYQDCDFCSIVIFYKMDGVPPTKVNIEF